jgi:hypothetical protein
VDTREPLQQWEVERLAREVERLLKGNNHAA